MSEESEWRDDSSGELRLVTTTRLAVHVVDQKEASNRSNMLLSPLYKVLGVEPGVSTGKVKKEGDII